MDKFMKLFCSTIKNSEQVEIYNREFQQRYNFGLYKQAEEIARENDLGKLLSKEQVMLMTSIGLNKTIHQINLHLNNLRERSISLSEEKESYDICKKRCNEELKTIDYWQRISNKRFRKLFQDFLNFENTSMDYWLKVYSRLEENN
jgi:hypothetical protein